MLKGAEFLQSQSIRCENVFTVFTNSPLCAALNTTSCLATAHCYGWSAWRCMTSSTPRATKEPNNERDGVSNKNNGQEPAGCEDRTVKRVHTNQQAQTGRGRTHAPAAGRWIHWRASEEHRPHCDRPRSAVRHLRQ